MKYFTTFATYKQKTNKCMKNLSLKTLALGILALFAVTTIDLLSIKGHSGKVEEYGPAIKDYGINIGDYNIPFDDNGDIKGGVKVKKVRPYLGLGFGRLIPKGRIGFRFELGAQFQGKPKVYAGDIDNVLENKQVTDAVDEETKDDIAEVMDWLKVYPVMKFSIRGRIL